MGEKPVTDLAGIGEVLGKRLSAKGYDKVCKLMLSTLMCHLLTSNCSSGVCRPRPVPGAEEERRAVCRVAKGRGKCQHQTGERLFPVFDRVVRTVSMNSLRNPFLEPLQNTPLSHRDQILLANKPQSNCIELYLYAVWGSFYLYLLFTRRKREDTPNTNSETWMSFIDWIFVQHKTNKLYSYSNTNQ